MLYRSRSGQLLQIVANRVRIRVAVQLHHQILLLGELVGRQRLLGLGAVGTAGGGEDDDLGRGDFRVDKRFGASGHDGRTVESFLWKEIN